jgi:outer membrane cobalamin receptor
MYMGCRYLVTLLDLQAEHAFGDSVAVQAGGRNLFDGNYEPVGGFPSEGRNLFVNFAARYSASHARP